MSNRDSNTPNGAPPKNLVDTAAANDSFHTLSNALEAAELTHVLKDSGPYTVFAPTDAAFEKLPKGTLENWLKPENKAELISVLKYHVLPGRTSSVEVEQLTAARMMQGQSAPIRKDGDKLSIGGARITERDIASSNGVIHAIDTVIVPTKP
ncbi:fasciclin domain-containing protein [Dyella koreensis]|uniref:Fasciclin domain-containing protein n=1 Tax=Dyella koreensis TaxID=311235 RepID=A0ABW8K537_9GAMM